MASSMGAAGMGAAGMGADGMGAVGMVARAELRRRLPALIALGLLTGIVAGLVGGTAGLLRRTATVHDRLERASRLADLQVSFAPDPALARRVVAAVPGVAAASTLRAMVARVENRPGVVYLGMIAPEPGGATQLSTPVVVRGRPASPAAPDEAVLDERTATSLGVAPGDRLTLRLLTRHDYLHFDTGLGTPGGALVTVTVTGLTRIAGVAAGQTPLSLSPAAAAHLDPVGLSVLLRLRPPGPPGAVGAAVNRALDAVAATVPPEPDADEFPPLIVTRPAAEPDTSAAAARRVLVTGLTVFGLVVGLAGLVTTAQVFARHHAATAHAQRIEAVLGLSPAGRVGARVLAAGPAALLAGLVGTAGPVLAGFLGPLGTLAALEPHPGYAANVTITVITGLGAAVAVLVLTATTAARAGRRRTDEAHAGRVKAGSVAGPLLALARRGPAWLWVGTAFALGRGQGGTRGARRPALAAAAVAVTGVVAAATIASCIDRLVSSPHRYGWRGADLQIVDARPDVEASLRADPRIAEVRTLAQSTVLTGQDCAGGADTSQEHANQDAASSEDASQEHANRNTAGRGDAGGGDGNPGYGTRADVAQDSAGQQDPSRQDPSRHGACREIVAYGFVGDVGPRAGTGIGWTLFSGHEPRTAREVVLGPRIAGELALVLGDALDVATVDGHRQRFTVVGTGIGPVFGNEQLGASLLLHPAALTTVAQTSPWRNALLRTAPGVAPRTVADTLGADLELALRTPPGEVTNLGGIGRLPLLLEAALALLALAAVAHAVLETGRHRRGELAVLQALGFTAAQTAAVTLTMSCVLASLAVLIGIPAGFGLGRLAWWEIATATGVAPDPAVPAWTLALLLPAALAAGTLLAVIPARRAARAATSSRRDD
ncbi:FtsX-like permease family protein [Frankia sp. QA3]|uniref:FtsX-like permease family protein n=1 Tax=Frankia sp. QA3 TaxID=710111 RepID=UPI000269C6A2|nr:FtsX-like permease family protein [Frankia sp. QA3]EIV94476.1 ABC-type antimicrobial peptide transport system, permease component [Frankia sp. QA3]